MRVRRIQHPSACPPPSHELFINHSLQQEVEEKYFTSRRFIKIDFFIVLAGVYRVFFRAEI